MAEQLPTRIEAVTPAWLTARLEGRYPGLVVQDIAIVEVIHGTTTKVRANLTLNAAGLGHGVPRAVCIKSNLEDHAPVSMSHGLYDTEALFYRDIRPLIPLPAPLCYYAEADPRAADGTSSQGFILLEDVKAQGATFGANTRPVSVDEAAAALEDLATLHAHWWAGDGLDRFSWLETSHGPGTRHARLMEVKGGLPGITELLVGAPERAAVMPASVLEPDRFIAAYDALVAHEMASPEPRCFIHGDTHLGNSYRTTDGKLRWLDWQLVRKGRCFRELSYFLGCALTVEDRRSSERPLIGHYLDHLRAKGVAAPSAETAWGEYRLWPMWGLYCWIVTQDYKQPREVVIETIRRFAVAMDDFDNYGLLLG